MFDLGSTQQQAGARESLSTSNACKTSAFSDARHACQNGYRPIALQKFFDRRTQRGPRDDVVSIIDSGNYEALGGAPALQPGTELYPEPIWNLT
jgi:hypothetical protein